MSKQEEIKQALAAATPGPWEWQVKKVTLNTGDWGDGEFCVADLIHREEEFKHISILDVQKNQYGQNCIYCWHVPDAHFIAKAPEYIAYLLEENELLRKMRDGLNEESMANFKTAADRGLEIKRLRKELEEKESLAEKRMLESQDWEDEYHALKRRYEESDKSALEQHELLMDTASKFRAVSKELEEARKISFPRQPGGEGGWVIDYDFLDQLETRVYKESDYSADLEDLETMLLALEKVLGQEGEGNR
ncbi:hypothetical protein B2I21_35000 [Chryseobacterium mucoviscidosis]|nr:hypothetical protein B2I21_35000 [Chryseobacterium mucoviscidosis]